MLSCKLCPGEFRSIQGLRGHEQYMHRNSPSAGVESRSDEDKLLAEQFGHGLFDRLVEKAAARFRPLLEEEARELTRPLTDALVSVRERLDALEGTAALRSHPPGLCDEEHCHACGRDRQKIMVAIYEQFDKAARWSAVIPAHQELGDAMREWIAAGRPEPDADDDDGTEETPAEIPFLTVMP